MPTPVFDTYWRFAARRQEIFYRRVRGSRPPWTDDPVLSAHRFTNAYRAADRVSQYLIRHVAYAGDQDPEEVVFRVLIFKVFNKISTWERLASTFGAPTVHDFSVDAYDRVLTAAFESGERIYSAAYIMPAAFRGVERKHRTHLELVKQMLTDRIAAKLLACCSMREAYAVLLDYPGIGAFLAYQFVTDLNYTTALNFSEMEFTVAGPGARSGLRKCFADPGDFTEEDLIRFVAERQEVELQRRDIAFKDLWGRPLQLIDCQNLFCEVDKYARVAHPDVAGLGDRRRIKQRFEASSEPIELWFPPKWGLNDKISSPDVSRHARSCVPTGPLQLSLLGAR